MRKPYIIKNYITSYLFLSPWLIGFFVLTLYPMLYSLYLSFTDFSILSEPNWIGGRNYFQMFIGNEQFPRDTRFANSLWVTFRFVFISVPLRLIFALGIAMIMNQKLRFIPFYRTVYYIPTLLGGSVAIAVLWRQLFSRDGAVNLILRTMFSVTDPPSWIADPRFALYTLILLAVWQFGSPMIIFLAGLKQIPSELYEAADVDGAGKMTKFLRITIPALSPVIFFNLIMQTIAAFQSFTQAFVVSGGQGGPIDSTMFYSLYLFIRGFNHWAMGYAAAMAWFMLLIIAALTAIGFKIARSRVSYGE